MNVFNELFGKSIAEQLEQLNRDEEVLKNWRARNYDNLFNADDRNPDASEVTVEELENTTPEKFKEIVMKGSIFEEII